MSESFANKEEFIHAAVFLAAHPELAADPSISRIDDPQIAFEVLSRDPRFAIVEESTMAEQEAFRLANQFVSDYEVKGVAGPRDSVLGVEPVTLGIAAAILVLIQTEVTFERNADGTWTFKLKKKASPMKSLIELVRLLCP